MKESVAIAKEADTKKDFSPTKSDNSIHRVRNEPEMQLGSLRDVIGNIRRDGGTPSVESIAAELSGMPTGERAPALLALQQTHGNRYVQRVVAGIQAKLVVGQPGDIYEQEADRVADEVMRMPEPEVPQQFELGGEKEETLQTKPLANEITPLVQVQRQEEPEEEVETLQAKPLAEQITRLVQRQVEDEEEEETLQAKENPGHIPEVTPALESQINKMRGRGQLLPASMRAYFEPLFGYDFSQVRIHTDSGADKLSRALRARAFTTGQDVFFRQGAYNFGSSDSRELLAHELTHAVQQRERGSARAQVQLSPDEPEIRITSGIPRGVHDTRTAIYYAQVRRMFRFYTRMTNRELIQEAQRLHEFLIGPCADFGPEAQSEFAQLLIEMGEEMDHRLQQAEIGPNALPIIEGISWDPDDPLAGTTEVISPFGMLDVWTTFVRHPTERPARPRRPVRRIEMEEEVVTVPTPEPEPTPTPPSTPTPTPRPPTRSPIGPMSPRQATPFTHFTRHCTWCWGAYDINRDVCSGVETRPNCVLIAPYMDGQSHLRISRVDRARYNNGRRSEMLYYCDRCYRQGVDDESRRTGTPIVFR